MCARGASAFAIDVLLHQLRPTEIPGSGRLQARDTRTDIHTRCSGRNGAHNRPLCVLHNRGTLKTSEFQGFDHDVHHDHS